MSMAAVMSQMPDVWRRVLAEHVADHTGRCRACSATPGEAASWPCQTYKVAHHARGIATGEFPIPTLQPSPSRTYSASSGWPLEQRSRGGHDDRWELDGSDALGRRDDPADWNRADWNRADWEREPSWAPRRSDPWDDGWSASWSQDAGHPRDGRDSREASAPAPRTFDRSYGSTMDAPYGSSFGIDDRRPNSW